MIPSAGLSPNVLDVEVKDVIIEMEKALYYCVA